MKKLLHRRSVVALAACSSMQDNVPSWMPGSGAIR